MLHSPEAASAIAKRPGHRSQAGALVVRLNLRQRARLMKLARTQDATQTQVTNEAFINLLATLELDEPVHGVVPSEQDEPAGE